MEHFNYGLLITHNTYNNIWFCFDRTDIDAYWNESSSIKCIGKGNNADEALANYKSKFIKKNEKQ